MISVRRTIAFETRRGSRYQHLCGLLCKIWNDFISAFSVLPLVLYKHCIYWPIIRTWLVKPRVGGKERRFRT